MKFPPRDFFINIAAVAALYVSVISLITLLFQYIDYLFPDRLAYVVGYYDPYSGAIRFAIASLIIVFPLYLFFTRLVHQDLRRDPLKREGMFRKWLIYITLFLAGAVMAGDLITLINTYLAGETSTRFYLKVLVVLVLAGGVFSYYWQELKGTWEVREGQSKLIGALVALLVLGSVVAGFFIIGSPAHQRDLRFDAERLNHLQMIQNGVVNYWQSKEAMPETLSDLEDPLVGFSVPMDPETGESYFYRATGALSFELCATFALESIESTEKMLPEASYVGGGVLGEPVSWKHTAGKTCFERTLDPERFPPFNTKSQF